MSRSAAEIDISFPIEASKWYDPACASCRDELAIVVVQDATDVNRDGPGLIMGWRFFVLNTMWKCSDVNDCGIGYLAFLRCVALNRALVIHSTCPGAYAPGY